MRKLSTPDLITIIRERSAEYFESLGESITTPAQAVTKFLEAAMFNPEKEEFAIVYFDIRHHVTGFKILFQGTIDQSVVYPREVVKEALNANAAAVMVAHNHPGGSPTPSPADLKITQEIKTALNAVDIRLLDHLIITSPGKTVSLQELGEL
jgi:DNA repair protein RadC